MALSRSNNLPRQTTRKELAEIRRSYAISPKLVDFGINPKPEELISALDIVLSPIRLVPSHVFLHVFRECQQTLQKTAVPLPPKPKTFPWNLRNVCREWRHLIDTTSEFWVFLKFSLKTKLLPSSTSTSPPSTDASGVQDARDSDQLSHVWDRGLTAFDFHQGGLWPPATSPGSSQRALGLEKLALTNGKLRPLRISVKFGNSPLFVQKSKVRALLPLLFEHSSRVHRISFQTSFDVSQYLRHLPPDSFPTLKILRMKSKSPQAHVFSLSQSSLFAIAPNLSKISLLHSMNFEYLLAHFRLENIAALLLPNTLLSHHQLQHILKRCPQLVEFSIKTERALTGVQGPVVQEPVLMLNLAAIAVNMDFWTEPPWQSLVRMPSLIAYSANSYLSNPWPNTQFAIMPPQLSNLTRLTLGIQISPGQVWRVLHATPVMETFNALSGAPLTQRVLTALAAGDVCPALSSLGCVALVYDNEDPWESSYFHDGEPEPRYTWQRYPHNRTDNPFSQVCATLDMLEQRAQNSNVAKISQLRLRDSAWDRAIGIRLSESLRLKAMIDNGWDIVLVE